MERAAGGGTCCHAGHDGARLLADDWRHAARQVLQLPLDRLDVQSLLPVQRESAGPAVRCRLTAAELAGNRWIYAGVGTELDRTS
jgi:hypothetical protein